jgi:Zn-dependent protease
MRFSGFEIKELVKSLVGVSLIFGIATVGLNLKLIAALPLMLFTAGVGFLFHELAHKYLAQRYHCWAEFRANNGALLIGLLLSFTGFVLIAPGGVFIHGATAKQHGRIAFSGPFMNLLVALAFLGFNLWFPSVIFAYGFRINALLCAFNLIPFPPFDGFSVWRWSRLAYFLIAGVALILFVLSGAL